jgi:hypothetical protein
VRALVLLGKEELGKPLVKEELKLMQQWRGMRVVPGVKATEVTVEVRTPTGKIRGHRTVYLLSH